ncbi:hypothetical protein ACTHPH_07495 [Paenibacillus pasadenensis]|uniref:hypothetical protein n=1 Tax=Paenibacillus pasadenensis TaxID=217090 RepID=UPI000403F17E|nr:hypothetical protein [Paenibacillus pasadenensis]
MEKEIEIRLQRRGVRAAAAESLSPRMMAEQAGAVFPLSERVPDGSGEAFGLIDWHRGWLEQAAAAGREDVVAAPTHVKVVADDRFEAVISWREAAQAAFLFAREGVPLEREGPLRLYVPDGSSKCLNVKRVVSLTLLEEPELGGDAAYGFKSDFSPEDLRKRR